MKDNYFQDEYMPYNEVFIHESGFKIYLGDISSATDSNIVQQKNVGTVITAASNMDHVKFKPHVNHITYDVLDSKNENLFQHFDRFYELSQSQLKKTNMLVHCFAGVSRSATLVISYIMKKKNMNFKDAIAEVRKYRPKVLPNLGFERQLKKYQLKLKSHEINTQRKIISKTSDSKKHHNKNNNLGLPEIFGLMKTSETRRNNNINNSPLYSQPSSHLQYRKNRIGNTPIRLESRDQQNLNRVHIKIFNQTKKAPLRSFRKQSTSVNRKNHQNFPEIQIYSSRGPPPPKFGSLVGHKAPLNTYRKFTTQKNIRSTVLKDYL